MHVEASVLKAPVVLCCDVDPDRAEFRAGSIPHGSRLTWLGAEEGIPNLLEKIEKLEAESPMEIHFNWFIRADLQIAQILGHAAWPYINWHALLRILRVRGDEIGWHPHFWRTRHGTNSWFQEASDEGYMERCLRTGFAAIPSLYRPRTVRSGWDFHTASSLRVVSELGLVADFSALPGIFTSGMPDVKTGTPIVVRNWLGAPDRPYHPSSHNPRTAALEPTDRLDILEIPVSTFRLPWTMRYAKHARDMIRALPHQGLSEPYVTKRPSLFNAAVSYHLTHRNAALVPFVALFHADELLFDRGAYSLSNVVKNVSIILRRYKQESLRPCFRWEEIPDVTGMGDVA